MIHVYFGEDYGYSTYCAKQALFSKLTDQEKKEVIQYDGYKDPIALLNDDLVSMSLFGDGKRILFTGAYFLSSSRTGKKEGPIAESKQDYQGFLDYLTDPNDSYDLYLVVPGNVDSKNEMVMKLKSVGCLHSCEVMQEEDFINLALKAAANEKGTMEHKAAKMLYDRTQGDYLSFKNNLDKVLTYTKNVKEADIDLLVYKPLEDDIFEIVKSLLRGDTTKAIQVYEDLRKNGNEAAKILAIMGSQFRFFSLVAYFNVTRESNEEIAREISGPKLNVSKGRIYYVKKDLGTLTYHSLLMILSELGDLEANQRKNQDDLDTSLLLFLADFRRKYLSRR